MKNLPIGVQTFKKIIGENYLYVDKTKDIYNLFATGGQYYFLSRPRRFGKSLLISTLAELFSGNKELFKGLWIYDKIQWPKHPVIHLDFSKITHKSPETLEEALHNRIEEIAQKYNVDLGNQPFLKEKFGKLLEKLAHEQNVVILIDEYDKPIIEYMEAGDLDTAIEIRKVLKSFYAVIKASDAYLRFVFITGVSKFSKMSLFSDMNNLLDITLSDEFSTLLGYTETELNRFFASHLETMAEKRETPKEQLAVTIRKWYNGYSWDGENFVYNPFSILNLFKTFKFKNYWFATGTPSFLVNLIKGQQSQIMEFENLPVDNYTFETYDIDNMEIPALLFQTGYLTIKKVICQDESESYLLSYPNKEVRDSLLTHLFREYAQKEMTLSTQLLRRLSKAINRDDPDGFFQEIKSLFASIPYNIFIDNREAYYHTIIYLILSLSGGTISPEIQTNLGRIDAVLETKNKIYIMEFKMGSEQDALNQIKQKKYYEKYQGNNKTIVLIGIGFDSEKRNIGNVLMETI